MADISYVPGLLTAVVGESCWVLVEASPDSPVVTRIWQQFAQGAAADALLVGMLADGIGGTSGFALLTAGTDGRHRVYCRGAVCATVVTAAASDQIDGAELLTWREHVITGAGRVFLGQPPADAALRLPAASGVLLAGCVVVDFTTVTFLPDIPDTITVQPPGGDVSQAPNPVDTGQARPPGQERPDEYDFFWGATQMRTVEDAAVRGPDDGGPLPGAPGGLIDVPQWLADPGDSGSTVKRGDLPEPVAGTAPPDRIGPVVPALVCQNGHLNPPSGAACRRCGGPLPHDPVPVPRPVLGVLRLSLGDVITLDRDVVMGRNPRTDFAGADGEERPHVVKLPNTGGDVSRTHLRVTLDGWHVLVTDLNSTNGTMVTLPGRDPQQLRPADPMPIQPGTVVALAEGIDFHYEVTD